MTSKNTNDAAPEIPGWALVDAAFIYARKRNLVEDELLRFFDGQPPTWRHALSSQIPRRNAAAQIIEELTSGDSSNRALRVVLGAAGEGKSTVLLQVAAQMATVEGWRVWWRLRPQSGITEQDVLRLGNSGGNWLLVFDDAETLVDDLGQIFPVLHDVGLDGLHFLCCARDTDWEAVKGPELLLSWAQYIDIPEQQPLRGIDFDDALAIVEAWRGVGERGLGDLRKYQTDDERARALEQAASIPAARPQDGSFFGALLKVRFTKEGLLSHVANVMQRLTTRAVAQDNSLLDAFLYVSAVDAIGIDGLDQTVLADLLGVGRDRLVSKVVRPLADEAAAIPASHSVRTRHSDIARSTLVLVERGRFSTDLTEIFPSIVRQTIRTRQDGLYIHEFPKIIHCSRRLVASLPQDIAREHRRAVAVATAEGAIDEEPARLRYRDDLSQTLRWMGGFKRAEIVLRNTARGGGGFSNFVDRDEALRAFFTEWAVVQSNLSLHLPAAWLAGLALSDCLNPAVLNHEQASISCTVLGFAFREMVGSSSRSDFLAGLGATVAIGRNLNAVRYTRDFSEVEQAAGQLNAPRPDRETALGWLQDAVLYVGTQIQDVELVALGEPNKLTFKTLADLLATRRAQG